MKIVSELIKPALKSNDDDDLFHMQMKLEYRLSFEREEFRSVSNKVSSWPKPPKIFEIVDFFSLLALIFLSKKNFIKIEFERNNIRSWAER